MVVFFIFTSLTAILAMEFIAHQYFIQSGEYEIPIILIFLALVIIYSFLLFQIPDTNRKVNLTVMVAMIALFVIFATAWIKFVPTQQFSDFGNFWSRATATLHGAKLYQTDNDYFVKFAFQTGFMVYIAGMVKIFGYHIIAIQIANIVYQVGTIILTYLIAIKLFNNVKVARLASFFLVIDLDWMALNSQADNQYLGGFLYLLTFYLILRKTFPSFFLAGITLGLGCIVRPIGPVIIMGIVVYAIFFILFEKGKFNFKGLVKTVMLLLTYALIFYSAVFAIKSTGLNQYGLSNQDPQWKLVTGLNYKGNGVYTSDLDTKFALNGTRKQMNKQETAFVHEQVKLLNEHHGWLNLFINKLAILWSRRSMAADYTNFGLIHSPRVVSVVDLVAYMGSFVITMFAWFGSARLKWNQTNGNLFLLILPLFAFAAAELIIEVQGRYRIEFVPVLSIFAGYGACQLFSLVKSKVKVKREIVVAK
jgi:hypothetical protein